jgi:hypothetical protein
MGEGESMDDKNKKRMFILQFEHDVSQDTVPKAFGVDDKVAKFMEDAVRGYPSTSTKTDLLMRMIDKWSGKPELGGLLMYLATIGLSNEAMSRMAMKMQSVVEKLLSEEHDCENCDGYYDCDLPMKKDIEEDRE